MPYPISEQLIRFNRSGKKLSPSGFVIHSTATPNATAQNEHDYFNGGDRQASSHYFVDNKSIIHCIPESEQAWHAGQTANSKFLSVEMCEIEPFQEVWNKTVWLVADACVRYGWSTGPNVYSHRGISGMYKETNHTDPIQFLANHGKTWDQLLSAIDSMIVTLKTPVPVPQQAVKEVSTVAKIIAPDDIYLTVRVRESLSAQAIKDINKLGLACQKLELA